ncbi:MAG TPA: zinc ribbon domain-containing protein [Acidobacteriota bacterium]|mgnify:CR=1 FL=1|nr:zinc ribbon domain-containing protein [bacterium]HNX18763.1 zinc ribbon domain-containing protein [Acidobacteriota bacterium]
MPIYEYRCKQCHDEIEKIQQFSDKPLTKCEKCGGRLEKLLSHSTFVLKGGGWYSDGYRSTGKGSSSSSSSK